jgi:hypothetical protein
MNKEIKKLKTKASRLPTSLPYNCYLDQRELKDCKERRKKKKERID